MVILTCIVWAVGVGGFCPTWGESPTALRGAVLAFHQHKGSVRGPVDTRQYALHGGCLPQSQHSGRLARAPKPFPGQLYGPRPLGPGTDS